MEGNLELSQIDYNHNPFLECLPSIRNYHNVYDSLLRDDVFTPQDRQQSTEYKLHLLYKLKDVYQPIAKTLDLEKRISMLIRMGYIERNPHDKKEYESLFEDGIVYGK